MKDHISICVATFHRNQMLGNLLRKLAVQATEGRFDFSVVIIDNDSKGSAKKTVFEAERELGLDLCYEVEPYQIIPAARNRALRHAKGNFVAIIDDDVLRAVCTLVVIQRRCPLAL